jgi:hypothetical protein
MKILKGKKIIKRYSDVDEDPAMLARIFPR